MTTKEETTTVNYEQKAVGAFQFGTWSGNVFTNTWSDIQIALPSDDFSYYSYKDLKTAFGDGTVNGDNLNTALKSGKTDFIDCFITNGLSSIIFSYDTDCKDISPKEYLEKEKKDMSDECVIFNGYTDKSIAGRTFLKASFTRKGTLPYMDTYSIKINNSMLTICAVYCDESKNDMAALLNSITDASSSSATTSDRTSPKVQ